MHILSLSKPPAENEVVEMQTINQENIPEVGDLSVLEEFRARVNWSENIFVYKWEDIIKAFVLCMREGAGLQLSKLSIHIKPFQTISLC
ncbi:MAG: hypothetical protein Ct9H300mP20_07640 [Gammaproteobacteria bacterium]|nr:MAG: hypothetical protein Ct9H300mP20_07640 [Gammaproteobacteria bacterium]